MSVSSPLDHDRLSRYFARIGYAGPRDTSLAALTAIHRAHLLAIPYENLDIHLGRPITLDRDAAFAKLVDAGRGGWCYEMNGLLGRVLESLGFDVRYVAGAVGRAEYGEYALDNHLVIIVTLDRPWIVDVGFGDGFIEPLPLELGTYRQGFLEFQVSRDGEWWRVHNHAFGGADGFDFTLTPRTIASFAAMCHHLQTSPESSFVKSTVCERVTPEGLVILRSASFRRVTAAGVTNEVVPDASAFARVLRESFGLDFPPAEIDVLWPKAWASYVQWQAEQAAAEARA